MIKLDIYDSFLTEIDLSQNIQLEALSIEVCPLTAIDISNNFNLRSLSLEGNILEELDTSQNLFLESLIVNGNLFTSLDVSYNSNLTYFDAGQSSLLTNVIFNNPNLESLYISETKLSDIDLSNCINLSLLYMVSNQLVTLDLSQNLNIISFRCEHNQLIELNINNGNNTIIERMWAFGNPNLFCIQVDDLSHANSRVCVTNDTGWCKDSIASYSEQCDLEIGDISGIEKLKLYPNPVKNKLHIENTGNIIESLRLFSSEGKLIQLGFNENGIVVSYLDAGLYFIEVTSENKISTRKFVKE